MLSLYVSGDSYVHRIPAGVKLLILFIGSFLLFFTSNMFVQLANLTGICVLFWIAELPWRQTLRQLRTALVFMIPILLFHIFLTSWVTGLETVFRILVLLLLAILITLTTKPSDMIDIFERCMWPLMYFGISSAKVSMMLSMIIRFIPVMMREAHAINEAQCARGMGRHVIALLIPLLIKTLKIADNLSDAIDARGYDPEVAIPFWKRHK